MSTARLILQPLAIALALGAAVRASSVGIYSIPSPSMEPTLQVGDTIIVTPYVRQQRPQRGDVIVFRSPSSHDELVVKRVVATPGDLIATREDRVTIGGHTVAEPYTNGDVTGAIAPQIIPADRYYVLGDNRPNSYDSRQWGVIPSENVIGRARMVLWSSHASSSAPIANALPREASQHVRTHSLRLFRVIK